MAADQLGTVKGDPPPHDMASKWPRIVVEGTSAPVEWAELQRELIDRLNAAAPEFVARYTRPDGTLIWRSEWGGMDGSDDPYEAFMYLALLYAVGGSEEVYSLARTTWDSITWQWTEYGQIDREFDGYYDWMHHGEANLFHYFFGFTKPASLVERQRAARFAGMYMGLDDLAPNYDAELGIIRAPHTGSRGPRFVVTAEDYSTHRTVLDSYPPPFEDLRTVSASAQTCAWTDDEVFSEILEKMNQRTARGDIPLNLNATGQVTHHFLYSGNADARDWVIQYVKRWDGRARANGGVIPDNVGLSGAVGEYLDGKWWGGHYGWRWPHGLLTILEPAINAGINALMLTGDQSSLSLARHQFDVSIGLGRVDSGSLLVPHKHLDDGWTDFRPLNAAYAIQLWSYSQRTDDRARVELIRGQDDWSGYQLPSGPFAAKHFNLNATGWFEFISGRDETYPVIALRENIHLVQRQLDRMRSDEGDPKLWDALEHLDGRMDSPSLQTDGYAIHAWQEFCPVYFEALLQLSWGAPMHLSHGGLQTATFRYFDADLQRPGFPADVSALVSHVSTDSAVVELVNTHQSLTKRVILQAGAFAEHRITGVHLSGDHRDDPSISDLDTPWFEVELAPRGHAVLEVQLERFARTPSYETPWSRRESWPPLIQGRRGDR